MLLLVSTACSIKDASAPNKFSDPVLLKINDLKDKRATDSVGGYLRIKNPLYRREAALAFGSIQDSTASLTLGSALLEDPDIEVRRNAAFALGQTAGVQSVNALIPGLVDKDRMVVREVLEALGKVVEKGDMSALKEFKGADTVLQEGQAWGFYQLALRKKADSVITRKASEFLVPRHSYQTRLGAAHYFGRSSKIEGNGFEENLLIAAQQDPRPEVRMAAVNGFRHLDFAKAKSSLQSILGSEKDYRVRVNAVRVCQNFKQAEALEILLAALSDSNDMIQVTASEVVRTYADRFTAKTLSEKIAQVKSSRAKANLYGALLKLSPPPGVLVEITGLYGTADVYYKAALLSALGEAKAPLDQKALEFLTAALLQGSNEKVILTSAAAAIVSINQSGTKIPTQEFLKIYEQAMAQGDPAVMGIISSALTDPLLHYKEEIKDLKFLYQAKGKLQLPKDIESLQPLEQAINFLEGKEKPEPLKNEFNHPIDWALVKTIQRDQRVEISTAKGRIVLQLLVEEAPGTVANFIALMNMKYFDGKVFHRVVPNFVIQGGCNRGDGYGSEDYSIRSAFSLRRYSQGSVGMASAGKDTEGTQWFITHSPTPHLDGKYTIFAETVEGMEVVHRMEVGDKILEVKLLK